MAGPITIPKTMKAAVVEKHKEALVVKDVPVPEPQHGQVLIKVRYSGVCHTDVHVVDGDWGDNEPLNVIPGHEGCGDVVKLGPGVENLKVGDRVGVPWLHRACGSCYYCADGWETVCDKIENTGYTKNGGFAEFVVAPAEFVGQIPEGLSYEAAAPILCAGVTVLRALKESDVKPGQSIVVTGAAGGLGHLACQYAKVMGMVVIGITRKSTPEKEKILKEAGVTHIVDLSKETAAEGVNRVTGGQGANGCLCIAPALNDVSDAVHYVRKRGTIVPVCIPGGDFKTNSVLHVVKALKVVGSIVGGRNDLREALAFAAQGRVHCDVAVKPFSELNNIVNDLRAGKVSGRIVVKMP